MGGESTERRFTFDAPETPPHPFPSFSVDEGIFAIDSLYPVNHFIAYDQAGNAIQTITVPGTEGNLWDLRLSPAARTIALWAEDPTMHISALTDATAIR